MTPLVLSLLVSSSFAASLRVHGGEDASRLVVEREGADPRVFDFASQVHLPDGVQADDVSLRLTDAVATPTGDRVVSSWALRGEGSDGPVLAGWIAVLEPERTRLAGFPVDRVPNQVSVSDDGEVVSWSDDAGAHVRSVAPPPRPRVVLPPDVDPPLFEVDPVLWTDLDIVDFGLGGPDVSLELFDLVDWVQPIDEEPDEPLDLGPNVRVWGEPYEPGPGAQQLVSPVMDLPLPEGEGAVVATLGLRGRVFAVARGSDVAVWTVGTHVQEPVWTGSLPDRIAALTLLEGSDTAAARATLASGEVVDLELDAPWTRTEPDPTDN